MEEELKLENIPEGSDFDNPPDPHRVIEGLRDTGYDFNTAIADIIDNSIAAKATKISIDIVMDPQKEVTVYVADNGLGMNLAELKNAMKYGSNRRPDPSSLGKFGLGLKTASTSFCRKLSLVSRGKELKVKKVQWDLDYVAQKGWKLKNLPVDDEELELLDEVAGGNTGTLVIWENTDRIYLRDYKTMSNAKKALDKMLEKLRFHISAVYQRFLDSNFTDVPNIEISLNKTLVDPWDPFCRSEKETEELASKRVKVNLPDGRESFFTLKAYAIPRRDTYSDKNKEGIARVSTDYMGFYVYRENRLIHYGDWMNMFVKDPHDSLLRVDFSFDYTLDDAFNVDIKKSKIQLNETIYNFIRDEFLSAPKRAANDKYRKGVKQIVSDRSDSAHGPSNQNINEKAPLLENAKVTVTNSETGEVEIENAGGKFKHTLTVQSAEKPDETRVVPVDTLDYNVLWEPAIIEGKHAVLINKSHPYYQKIYYPVLSESVMVTGMDALLWALAETEFSLYNPVMKKIYEDIRIQVARALNELVADLPEPEISEE